jgi:uncharacterized protein (TIGR02391 family)
MTTWWGRFDSAEEIEHGINQLTFRLKQVEALARDQVRHDDSRVANVTSNIRKTLLEVFNSGSAEYQRHVNHDIWNGPHVSPMTDDQKQRAFQAGVPRTVAMLTGLIRNLEERRQLLTHRDVEGDRALDSVGALHPRIAEVSRDLFRNRHYRNAVLDGYLALENFVKEKSRCRDVDGADLMRRVFSKKAPILAFNDGTDESKQNEQEGLMHIFEGVALALRNPRAHS